MSKLPWSERVKMLSIDASECAALRARIAELEKIREEWSERFGFIATENPRDSIESIDEVAIKIFEKDSKLRDRIAELEKIREYAEKVKDRHSEACLAKGNLLEPCTCVTAELRAALERAEKAEVENERLKKLNDNLSGDNFISTLAAVASERDRLREAVDVINKIDIMGAMSDDWESGYCAGVNRCKDVLATALAKGRK